MLFNFKKTLPNGHQVEYPFQLRGVLPRKVLMEDTLLMYEFKLIDVKTKQWISMALLKELFLTFEVAKS